MAEENKNKQSSPLIGAIAQPTTLDNTTKIDIDTGKSLMDNIIDTAIGGGLDISRLEDFTSVSNARSQIYTLIDTMATDASVAAILKTYAEEVCETADNGHIMWCESTDPNISRFVNYLLNVMNVDKNIYAWVYCLLKYGDVYLKLYRESDYKDEIFNKENVDFAASIKTPLHEDMEKEDLEENVKISLHKTNDRYSYYAEMIPDPGTMFELTKYGKTYGYIETPNEENPVDYLNSYLGVANSNGQTNTFLNYKMKSNDVIIHQADDFVHACLDDNFSRFPEKVQLFRNDTDYASGSNAQSYSVKRGKSLLIDVYKVWREKTLLENAILLNRLTKSSVVRNIQVEVGDMPKSQVQTTLRRIKELFEQKSAIDTGNGMIEYNNPGPVENNIYTASHNGQGAITVNSVGGDIEVKNLGDLDEWVNKFYAAFGIPKQYYGYCLHGDTELLLLDGSKHTIAEMSENSDKFIGKGIMGCNQDGSLCPTTIKNVCLTRKDASFLRIWLDNNKYVDVTPDHRMMLRSGEFIEAKDLQENDSLMPFYSKVEGGRRYVLDNKSGKYLVQFHVVGSKKFNGLEHGYQIHHKNKIKADDDFDNLEKLTFSEHCKVHNKDLSVKHKENNNNRRANGEMVNKNVGSKSITDGFIYKKIKKDEEIPDGFWLGGNPKSQETRTAISKGRKHYFSLHPEAIPFKERNHFFGQTHPKEVRDKMSAANKIWWENASEEACSKRKQICSNNGKKRITTTQNIRMEKMNAEKPDVIRKIRKLRCPYCGDIFEKKLNNIEYDSYMACNKLHFCCKEHRGAMDPGGKLARSFTLFRKSNNDLNQYELLRHNNESRPDTFLTASTLDNHLNKLLNYVPEVNHVVTKIEVLNDTSDAYDIEVTDDCHTFAIDAGIFVHNCEDGAGFNGGPSLAIISSVFAKSVKRVQNSMIQAITDAINLFLLNRGCKTYINNFVLKMKAPLTQEEKDYREDLSNRVNAISNMQALFADVEDKGRKLKILKSLLGTLNYGDELLEVVQSEIDAAEAEKAKLEAEEEEAKSAEAAGESGEENEVKMPETPEESNESDNTDLGLSSIAGNPVESFSHNEGEALFEGSFNTELITEDSDLPSPEEVNKNIDFTKNV